MNKIPEIEDIARAQNVKCLIRGAILVLHRTVETATVVAAAITATVVVAVETAITVAATVVLSLQAKHGLNCAIRMYNRYLNKTLEERSPKFQAVVAN